MSLTPQQAAAAHDTARVVRLVAGPGTGKSSSIEERVVWLLQNNVAPETIYAFSFTRLASKDLAKRIKSHCAKHGLSEEADKIHISTIHALALKILGNANLLNYFPSEPVIMDTWEEKGIFDSEYSCKKNIKKNEAEDVRNAYEASWNILSDNPIYNLSVSEKSDFEAFHKDFKQTYSCLLPGEMVKECVDHIQKGIIDPIELTGATNLIVDEFQDLNPCDQDFVKCFYDAGANIFIAGDDDQSLYSFRNAAPDGLINIPTTYPGASSHELPDCFRCTPNILKPALALVGYNRPRLYKNLISHYSTKNPPLLGHFELNKYRTGDEEASCIASSCAALIKAGVPADEIYILVAAKKAQAPEIENALSTLGLPFDSLRGKSIKNSLGGRLLYSLLRILNNDDDYLAYRTILCLSKSVGIKTCVGIHEKVFSNSLNFRSLFIQPLPPGVFSQTETTAIENIGVVKALISSWSLDDTIDDRIDEIEASVLGIIKPGSELEQEFTQTLRQNIGNTVPGKATLRELLDYVMSETEAELQIVLTAIKSRILASDSSGDSSNLEEVKNIKILTFHGSKGLSATFVFIPGLENGILPDRHSIQAPGLLSEKRRVLYVGITRARLGCYLSFADQRIGRQARIFDNSKISIRLGASQFLTELGISVQHKGCGFTAEESQMLKEEMAYL